MSLTNYENGVAMVKRLRTTALKGYDDGVLDSKLLFLWTSSIVQ
jgi:hypothetical protein